MDYTVKTASLEKQRSGCLIVPVGEGRKLTAIAAEVDQASDGYLSALLKRGDFDAKLGQTLTLFNVPGIAAERLLLVGAGREKDLDNKGFQRLVQSAVKALLATGATEAVSYLTALAVKDTDLVWCLQQTVLAIETALYRFDRLKSKAKAPKYALRKLILAVENKAEIKAGEGAVQSAVALASGMTLCKDLGNLPGNICTPGYLVEQAHELAKAYKSITAEVLDRARMEELGMGSLLSVAQGSAEPPYLIVLEYRNGPAKQKPIVLVGKGVTFDTGGISIKPSGSMDEMKYDMGGAASVLGTLKACAEMKLALNVVVLVPTVENMPSGTAIKPGDVVTSLSGQTIEILNTDAEGRLILCDALSYAERFEPQVIIDVATLTGACMVALGKIAHGLFSNHPPLAKALLEAGQTANDRAWELPVWEDYQDALDSNFADMANVGDRYGGAITAACFLARFVRKQRWAHLDVAGTAWKSGKAKGSSGRPVPLLVQYLMEQVG